MFLESNRIYLTSCLREQSRNWKGFPVLTLSSFRPKWRGFSLGLTMIGSLLFYEVGWLWLLAWAHSKDTMWSLLLQKPSRQPSQLHAFLHPCPWAASRRSWCSLLLSHAALVLVIVGPVLFLMLHFWVLLVHWINNLLPSFFPWSTLRSSPSSFPSLVFGGRIKFWSQHLSSCSFLLTERNPPFCLLVLYTSFRKMFLTLVLPLAYFYIPITASYADLEHGTFCTVLYFLISLPGELFKGKTLGLRLTHRCLSGTQHHAWWWKTMKWVYQTLSPLLTLTDLQS